MQVMGYGSGGAFGEILHDNVCLNREGTICAPMKFVGVAGVQGLEGLKADGIVGLSPTGMGAQLFMQSLF